MAALHILVADDQIPPSNEPEQEYRNRMIRELGERNKGFVEQCIFMGKVVQGLKDYGYRVTSARTYSDAKKQISRGEFDLAIIDLTWWESSMPERDRTGAGWGLCQLIDERDKQTGRLTPQIVFSSQFPEDPALSQRAATERRLPIFKTAKSKEAGEVSRNSLMAAVGFVEATLKARDPDEFRKKLTEIVLDIFKEPLREHHRWAFLTLLFVACSLALLVAGVVAVFVRERGVATLTSIAGLVSTTITTLLYRRLGSLERSLQNSKNDALKQLEKGIAKPSVMTNASIGAAGK